MSSVRKKLEKAWFSLLLFGFICIGVFRVFQNPNRQLTRPEYFYKSSIENHERQLKAFRNELHQSTNDRYVTKATNFQNGFHLSDHVLFFNRVPKAGSEMLVLLLQWLQGSNNFRHVRLPGGEKRRLNLLEQEKLVDEITKTIRREAIPVSFDRHVYFVNFTKFDKQSPIYINLVRDPIDKAISRFYYGRVTPNPKNPDIKHVIRSTKPPKPIKYGSFEDCVMSQDPECSFTTGKTYDLAIPYFCGHDKQCMVLNDKWALRRAKKNVEKYFPVVGVLEELNATLSVLENKLPIFFKGVQDMYFRELLEPHKNANRMRPRTTDIYIRDHLKTKLKYEYDFYYWLKSRILNQWRYLSNEDAINKI